MITTAKRRLAFSATLLFLLVSLCACSSAGGENRLLVPGSNARALDGKKVIFVGCSYTYYGGTVRKTDYTITSQEKRSNDQGYFYQLCKANGAEVSVTDWCYGGHDLTDLFDGHCDANNTDKGHDHLADLTDRYFDYVVLQEIKVPGDWSAEDYLNNAKGIMEIFREANPNVQFFYVVHDGVYTGNYSTEWKNSVKLIQEEGAVIIDWGTLVWDVINGDASVPGAEQKYNKSSFIVSTSQSDGYHPNLLSGYLNALMTYCAITGETAVGQPAAFLTDGTMEDYYFDIDTFARVYYKWDDEATEVDESKTNFREVFRSETDMKGLQTLANEYLENPFHLGAE